MKILGLVILILSFETRAADLDFFKIQAEKAKASQSDYKYEDLIAGGAAFVLGNIGFFTTDSTPLRVSYSLVQTIGILNISDGIYQMNNPSRDEYYYQMFRQYPAKQNRDKDLRYFSRNLIAITAKNDRAVRIARFYRSTLLTAQYLINTVDRRTSEDLKDIYYFMAGINVITAAYSYFARSNYE